MAAHVVSLCQNKTYGTCSGLPDRVSVVRDFGLFSERRLFRLRPLTILLGWLSMRRKFFPQKILLPTLS